MEFHEAANLFPLLEGQAYEDFKEDIRKNGQAEPIVYWRGKILDGRNRYRACNDLGIIPLTREILGDLDPIAFVLSENLHRRHLTESQRAMVGAKAMALYEKDAKQRQREGGKRGGESAGRGRPKSEDPNRRVPANLPEPCRGESREKAAEVVNVSPRTIQHASKVLENGTPELNRMVESDAVSVSAAAAVATLPRPEQAKVVEKGPEAVREKAKEMREAVKPVSRSPQQEADEDPQRRWYKLIHDLYRQTNGIRDVGGIERVARNWSSQYRIDTAQELDRLCSVLSEYAAYLRKGG